MPSSCSLLRSALAAGLTCLCLCLAPGKADAKDTVAQVEEYLQDLRFEEADELARKAVERGEHTPAELAQLYLLSGQVAASIGEVDRAERAFLSALSIDDNVSLASGVSPKLLEPFDAAKRRLSAKGRIAVSSRIKDDRLEVKVTSDPANLVAGVEVEIKQGRRTRRVKERGETMLRVEVPASHDGLSFRIVDRYGNYLSEPTLFEPKEEVDASAEEETEGEAEQSEGEDEGEGDASEEEEEADEGEGDTRESSDKGSERPVFARWQLYAGLSVAGIGSGTFFGLSAQKLASDIEKLDDGTEFSVAKAMEEKAQQRALFANISFAAAGVMAVASIWLYTREDDRPDRRRAQLEWVPTFGPDGAGVSAFVEF